MVKAKSCKIILLLTAVVMFVLAICSLAGASFVARAEGSSARDYFNGTVAFADDNVVATLNEDNDYTFSVKNKLVLNNLGLKLKAVDGEKISKINVSIAGKSYFANGNMSDENLSAVVSGTKTVEEMKAIQLDTTIKNTVSIDFENNTIAINGGSPVSATITGDVVVSFTVNDGLVSASVNDATVTATGDYYKIAGLDKYVGTLSCNAELKGANKEAQVSLVYVNQRHDLGDDFATNPWVQNFVLFNSTISNKAAPRVVLDDSLFVEQGKLVVKTGERYYLSTTSLSVCNFYDSVALNVSANDTTVGASGEHIALNKSNSKAIWFFKSDRFATQEIQFNIYYKLNDTTAVADTYKANVVDASDLGSAPEYVDLSLENNKKALASFKVALLKATSEDYGEEYGIHSIRLGSSVTVPSMLDLVKDDTTSYKSMTHTLYTKTPTSGSSTTSSWSFTVNDVGNFEIYCAFKDAEGNAMVSDDFYTVKDNVVDEGMYFDFVFDFKIEDDAPVSVKAPESQEDGFVNVRYKASAFTVNATKVEYKLYYNPSLTAQADPESPWKNEWIQIDKESNIDSSKYPTGGISYNDVKNIAYDGTSTFTPIRKGSYLIECIGTSETLANRSDEAVSIIRVEKEPTIVVPPSTWASEHALSIVFLTVGSACLVGVLVLLFIKPKKKDEE